MSLYENWWGRVPGVPGVIDAYGGGGGGRPHPNCDDQTWAGLTRTGSMTNAIIRMARAGVAAVGSCLGSSAGPLPFDGAPGSPGPPP
ncbi:unnamed protein product [Boreogadus saida]